MKSFAFLLLFIGLLMLSGLLRMFFPADYNYLVYGILGCLAGYLTVFVFLRIDKKSWSDFGFSWDRYTILRFLAGIGIGIILMAVVITSLVSLTALRIRFEPGVFHTKELLMLLQVFPLALMEEIGFRSYPQRELNNKYGVWVSQLAIAVAFALYHILNGWTVGLAFTGPFVWAFIFGLSALWSGGIAMPTGIHFALNILQTIVGMKGTQAALWRLDYPPGTAQSVIAKTDTAGFLLHGAVLIVFLIATYFYNNKVVRNR
jgi:membrane protease YdiL (CAAX protease family)